MNARELWSALGLAAGTAVVATVARHFVQRTLEAKSVRPKQSADTPIPSRGPIIRGVEELRAPVADALRRVLVRMRERGHDPRVFETARTHGRALWLERKGTGIERSTHRLGLAADIIDRKLLWKARPEFWADLADIGEQEGFVTLSHDKPHLQAIEVGEQAHAWDLYERGDEQGLTDLAAQSLARRRETCPDNSEGVA